MRAERASTMAAVSYSADTDLPEQEGDPLAAASFYIYARLSANLNLISNPNRLSTHTFTLEWV